MSQRRKKICLVITELDFGGAEQNLVRLACGIDRNRYEPSVCVLSPPPQSTGQKLLGALHAADVPCHFLGVTTNVQLPLAVSRLRRHWQGRPPAVVASFLFHANVVSAWARRRTPTAWIASIRVADPTGWRQWLERRALRSADVVSCVSQSVADYAERRLRVAPDRIAVIPNGVDLARYTQSEPADLTALGIPKGQPCVTFVGRLHQQKGLDDLLKIIANVLPQLPDRHLLVVGAGPDRGRLEQLARSNIVAERIHFAGWQPDIAGILQASEVLVLPSRWEGMPNVLLEAMACGRACVCFDVEGVREVLGRLAEHQVVPPGDLQRFSCQLLKLCLDNTLRDTIGSQNQQQVGDNYTLESMIRTFECVLQAAAAKKK